ncbi:MAG: 30S ribosomal protein S5 [Patescibacteria group bacterium]|jgi:small subunit ribosomal protein S5|nr:30S ribosomal protein S5 [Patescibacteria group bacterium]
MAEEKQVTKENKVNGEVRKSDLGHKDGKALAQKPESSVVAKEKAEVAKTGEKAIVAKNTVGKSVYGEKKFAKKRKKNFERDKPQDEFEQKIVDLARVTRVMAGGKRMRFRACVAIGNKKGKVAIGLAKGADVTLAVSKAVANAKKEIIDVSIINETIPHEIYQKTGAAKILFKPARKGKGVIAGGAVRIILELAGVTNITSKILGTNNKVSIAKCTIEALSSLKKVEKREPKKKPVENKEVPKNIPTKTPAVKKTS